MSELMAAIGRMLIAGFESTILPEDFKQTLSENNLGGVILFKRNYKDCLQLKELTNSVKQFSNELPFIAVDQEGGRVVRFAEDFPVYPSPAYYGSRQDRDGYLSAIKTTTEYLKKAGVNLNLTPVCDLAVKDQLHVMFERSYSDNPDQLAKIVSDCYQVQSDAGLLSCAKHFPGLQSGSGDPHHKISISDNSAENFRKNDYQPFRAIINAGIELVMVTHLLVRSLDPDNIVTFSKKIIEKELKEHLGFSGLVVTDCLQMAGASQGLLEVETAVKAILAGCDILIFGNLENKIENFINELEKRAEQDTELFNRILTSAAKISSFKKAKRDFLI